MTSSPPRRVSDGLAGHRHSRLSKAMEVSAIAEGRLSQRTTSKSTRAPRATDPRADAGESPVPIGALSQFDPRRASRLARYSPTIAQRIRKARKAGARYPGAPYDFPYASVTGKPGAKLGCRSHQPGRGLLAVSVPRVRRRVARRARARDRQPQRRRGTTRSAGRRERVTAHRRVCWSRDGRWQPPRHRAREAAPS